MHLGFSCTCAQECGIGWQSSDDSPGRSGSGDMGVDRSGAGHRVLVFAQLKGLLELVESDVLRPGGISFLRLDGRSARTAVSCTVRCMPTQVRHLRVHALRRAHCSLQFLSHPLLLTQQLYVAV